MEIVLTPAEQAKLDSCVNPDADRTAQYDWSPETQNELLKTLWSNKEFLDKSMGVVRPEFFRGLARQRLATILTEYYKTYGDVPSENYIGDDYCRRWPNDDEPKVLTFKAEVKAIKYCFEPELHARTAMLDKLTAFAEFSAIKKLTSDIVDGVFKSDKPDKHKKIAELIQTFTLPALNGMSKPYATWPEIVAQADAQVEDWLIHDWAEFGCMVLFSSLPKLGKSTIIAGLAASLMTGTDFYGLQLKPAPVLLVDPENTPKTLVRRLRNAMGGEVGRSAEWLFRMNQFAKPLDLGLLRRTIEKIKEQTGQKRIVVVLDTLRSCYAGAIENENDNSEMAAILVPLKDLAAETNSCLIIVHHNSKSADNYSGGTAILGCVDYHWLWRCDKSKFRGTLSVDGRGDPQEPIDLTYDRDLRRNVPTKLDRPVDDVDLRPIPFGPATVTAEYLQDCWQCGERTARDRLKSLVDDGKVCVVKPANRKEGKYGYSRVAAPVEFPGAV